MATDYYSNDAESSDAPEGGASEATPKDAAPQQDTALLPKSFFKDNELEVGAQCEVKIEHVYDDEVEVSYVKHSDSSKPEMDSAMAGMDEMASPEE